MKIKAIAKVTQQVAYNLLEDYFTWKKKKLEKEAKRGKRAESPSV